MPSGLRQSASVLAQPGQLFGSKPAAILGQPSLGLLAGRDVHPAGQLVIELADHRDLTGPQCAVALTGRGGGQGRWQRFAGQAVPRAQVPRLLDAPGCLGAADQRRLGDRMAHGAADL
ncbi:hypothetical protein MTY59_49190 [Mycobacterium senriense]|uniref:Uncharacterized protein n=1 Tax=Mycobacterium senriense TaxID=2775496 RepID=A0ABM7SUK0_9MYCO|nr:hypothetical protein MTY59_49190 [Mycobacterium senriense]